MRLISRVALLVSASALSSGICGAALASEAAAAPGQAPDRAGSSDDGLGEIVVTARRREESILDVPVAITALSGKDLDDKMLRTTDDIKNFVPGLNVTGLKRDDSNFYIRGQGPGSLTGGQRNFSSIATYFAEVPTTITGTGVFYDLSNVQVLKGPQGTLFGRNSTGGAVLFEPAAPGWKDEFSMQAQFGNYNFKQFDAVVNLVPVAGKVAIRVAGEWAVRDGFTRSVVTGQDLDNRNYQAFRISLRLTPSEGIDSTTIFSYRNRNQNGTSQVIRALDPTVQLGTVGGTPALAALAGLGAFAGLTSAQVLAIPLRLGGAVTTACLGVALPGCPAPLPIPAPFTARGGVAAVLATAFANNGLGLIGFNSQFANILASQQALGARQTVQSSIGIDKGRDWSITNRTTIGVSDTIVLKNIVSFQKTRRQIQFDFDGTPLPILDSLASPNKWADGSEQFTEEFQVQGKAPSAHLEYLAGFYYEREKPGLDVVLPGVQAGSVNYPTFSHLDTSKALFAHAEWTPVPSFSISGGIRHTWDTRTSSTSRSATFGGACTLTNPATGTILCPIEYTGKFGATTWDATATFRPARGVLTYASYRHGYKSGGFNLPAPLAVAPLPVDAYQKYNAEFVDEIELGLKAAFELGAVPVQMDMAYFHDQYKDAQTGSQKILTTTAGPQAVFVIDNAASGTNQGFEFSGSFVPVQGLKLSGFLSYIDAHFNQTIPGATVAGRQIRNTPKWKYGLGAAYTLPLDDSAGNVVMAADYAHQSDVFVENGGTSLVPFDPGYGILNLRLSWNDALRSNIDLALFATNVTDKLYFAGGYPVSQLGFQAAVYGEPRMIGGSIKFHY